MGMWRSITLLMASLYLVMSCFLVLIYFRFEQVVFKMDHFGNREEIVLDKVFDSVAGVPSFRNFDKELFTGDFLVTF